MVEFWVADWMGWTRIKLWVEGDCGWCARGGVWAAGGNLCWMLPRSAARICTTSAQV